MTGDPGQKRRNIGIADDAERRNLANRFLQEPYLPERLFWIEGRDTGNIVVAVIPLGDDTGGNRVDHDREDDRYRVTHDRANGVEAHGADGDDHIGSRGGKFLGKRRQKFVTSGGEPLGRFEIQAGRLATKIEFFPEGGIGGIGPVASHQDAD